MATRAIDTGGMTVRPLRPTARSVAAPVARGRLAAEPDSVATRGESRARRYDPAETKQRVLAAANLLFSTKGFAATGTADIAREADVSEGSIFYHFGSKKALLGELGIRHGRSMIEAMEAGDALADLEPGIIIPRVFEFCRTNMLWEGISGSDCGADGKGGAAALIKNPDAEPFYHAAKATTVEWIERQMAVGLAKRGITGIDIELAASFTHHIVGDAIERILGTRDPAEAERVERETVRFVRAACGYPTA